MSVTELSQLLFIDEPTIESQVLPSLNELSTPTALRAHLESLLGFSPEAKTFTSTFVQNRFSNNVAPTARMPAQADSRPIPRAPSQPNSRPASRPPSQPPSRSQTPLPRPIASSSKPIPHQGPKPVDFPIRLNPKQVFKLSDDQVLDLMSASAKKELREIERGLKMLSSSSEDAGQICHCQARKHPLSRYQRICPKCCLILCQLNSPAQPCPSCSHSPLLPQSVLESHQASEIQRKTNLMEKERSRLITLWEEQEAEAAKEKFPELGNRYAAGGSNVDEIARKIQNAYNGQQQPGKEEPRKVLSLNMKTKQVIATTTTKEKKVKEKEKAKVGQSGPIVDKENIGKEEVLEGWIDEEDLGYIERSKGKKKQKNTGADDFKLVYVPLTMAEMREKERLKKEEESQEPSEGSKGLRIKVPGMA